jgi:hypothetical protein
MKDRTLTLYVGKDDINPHQMSVIINTFNRKVMQIKYN